MRWEAGHKVQPLQQRSMGTEARSLGNLGIDNEFVLNQLGKANPIERQGISPNPCKPFLDHRALQHRKHFPIKPIHDGRGSLRRQEEANPKIVCGFGIARLLDL